jgi:cytochrome c553
MKRKLLDRLRRLLQGAWAADPQDRGRSGRAKIKRRLLQITALLVLVGVLGFLVAASGIVPIGASSGHWPITAWLLKFSMHRSVATHSLGIEVPSLDEPSLIWKGAAQYDIACAPCHGSPEFPTPRIASKMLPFPPYLPPVISQWDPEELFYVVKHGVKFTGMPAWPSQERDDEVWAMVAFLLTMPKLDVDEYRRVVGIDRAVSAVAAPIQQMAAAESVPRSVVQRCARCHGIDGGGGGLGAFPRLAGQRPVYLENALRAFAAGRRHSGIMEPIAAALTAAEMREAALYFSRQSPPRVSIAVVEAEKGAAIAAHGIPSRKVPACRECHGPSPIRKNPAYPLLAAQHRAYLEQQFELFKTQRRGGSPYAHLMRPVAAALTSDQMREVAHYYASLQ